ncbi:MAG: alpha/beta hydrolase family protein [Elusimicrobia bacterium]|nr:alpha/beta hydrolase family protein [Elusimicrobiota bacterium]
MLIAAVAWCEQAPEAKPLPRFVSGKGITVVSSSWKPDSDRTVIVNIQTPLISEKTINGGVHQVWITLPEDYSSTSTARLRYPVLYLLHGGAGGNAGQWVGGGAVEPYTKGLDLITVMPDGGKVGWYTDWVDETAGAQKWETFHAAELIPWIDANLRTNAKKEGRAIAGLSMGGYGAFHYGFRRPDLFIYVGSFSGALDLEDFGTQMVIAEQCMQNGLPRNGPFGSTDSSNWSTHDPLTNVEKFRGMNIAMYAGAGTNDVDVLERTMGHSADKLHKAFDKAGIPHLFTMYGRPGGDSGCDGGHNMGCWNFALKDALPKMMTVLSSAQGSEPAPGPESDSASHTPWWKRIIPPWKNEFPTAAGLKSATDIDWDGSNEGEFRAGQRAK